jgi:hypothetical protein
MKIASLIVLVLLVVVVVAISRRRVARAEAAAALARARAERKNRIPAVSNNLKGVTATQTIQPFRSQGPDDFGGAGDERAA